MNTFKNHWQSLNAAQKQQLADGVDCNKDYLSRVAHGHANVSLALARCLAADLETPLADLFPGHFRCVSDLKPIYIERVEPRGLNRYVPNSESSHKPEVGAHD